MRTADERQAGAARRDWERRIGRRSGVGGARGAALPPPAGLRADAMTGGVALDWDPVPGAAGYLITRAPGRKGPFEPLDHGGGDVLAIPSPPYADTTDGAADSWYAVATVTSVDAEPGSLSAPVRADGAAGAASSARTTGAPIVPSTVRVRTSATAPATPLLRPWRPVVGSEHLSMLLYGTGPGGRHMGDELAEALSIAHRELHVEAVRAHAILLDELGTYREVGGVPQFDFTGIDRVYDRLLGLGVRPVVELSFMPRDLAADPSATVFEYHGIISPPKDWDRWAELIERLARHLIERYGVQEVRRWRFEVWNEPNLTVFWTGSQADYFRLYDVTAAAVRRADDGLRVGGPSTAAAGWVEAFLDHVRDSGAPLDFVSTHEYGNPPLDVRAIAERCGWPDIEIVWTEWGVQPRHFNPVHDLVFAAPFVIGGMHSIRQRSEALSYWVVSDHFEELGRPPRLMHGGFGLLTVGNLRKPRFWALALLERLGELELPTEISGDGAGSLVRAWASRDADGRIGILIWNGTLDQSKVGGDPNLDRQVEVAIADVPDRRYTLRHFRIDATHSNIGREWQAMGSPDWPTDAQWDRLHAANRLDELEPAREIRPNGGATALSFPLPMPGVSFVELSPSRLGEP